MFKFFTSDLRRNIIKILCLSIGLSIGLLLVARVYFDKSYDTFFKDADRIYKLYETLERDGEYSQHPAVSGGVAPLFQKEFPQVEIATRILDIMNGYALELEDGRKIDFGRAYLADENLFEVFKIPVTGGNPSEILKTGGMCVIPRSLALKIGGDVIGSTFTVPKYSEDKKYTIGAIYDDLPLNSSIGNSIYISLATDTPRAHGRDGLVGNDVYTAYIKMMPGSTPEDIAPGIEKFIKSNLPEEFMTGLKFNIIATGLTDVYSTQKDIRTMDWMLMLLAAILILSSGLNYLLIVVGQIGKRSKEMAVRKCYGTSNIQIFGRVMGESLFYLFVSVAIGVLIVFCFPELCARLLGYTPGQLFTTGNVWIVILGVCLVILILTGVIPAWIYCRTPVASAFRGNLQSRRGWKMALLSIQFFSSGVLMCLLVLIVRQYRMIATVDNGFDTEGVAYVYLSSVKSKSARLEFVSELKNLSCVKDVTSSETTLGDCASGNNVWMNGNIDKIFNVADNYNVNANFFDMMGIEFIQGETFSAQADSTINQVVVEKSFIDVVKKLTGDDSDYIVGKSFQITEHGLSYYTICGVINDIRRGDIIELDGRAGVWFPSNRIYRDIYIKLYSVSPENIKAIQDVVDNMFPDSECEVVMFKSLQEGKMTPIRNFATSVMIAGIAILFIALVGLIGYTGDEVQRRSKEIAIRKVTGSSAREIVSLFVRNIFTVAVPSLIAGGVVAMIAGRKWLSQFAEQVSLSPISMILCVIALLLLITGVVAYNTMGVATTNPVDHLRNE